MAEKFDEIARVEARHESFLVDDAEYLVVSFGTTGPFVDYVVEELRADGIRIGSFRPITLWPFPEQALAEAAASGKQVLVYEINAGQMIDDVRLSVADRAPVRLHRRRERRLQRNAPGIVADRRRRSGTASDEGTRAWRHMP